MKFSELLSISGVKIIHRGGSEIDPVVSDIVYDSRLVKPGSVFVAVPGLKVDGDTFIISAIRAGAVAVISQNCQKTLTEAPWAVVSDAREAAGVLGRTLWNVDISTFTSVGITGTNGKTTTAHLFKTLFDKVVGKEYSWMFGTIENSLGVNKISASHTTPESLDLFRYIDQAELNPKSLCMEVSSHSLALKRVAGMKYDLAVWSNLTQDHLDLHGSMEEYYGAKKLLFTQYLKQGGRGVINIDDSYGRRLWQELRSQISLMTYGGSEDAQVRITDYKCDWDGCRVTITFDGQELKFESALRGFFNVYNMTALISGALALGIDHNVISDAFRQVSTVSGRMDKVDIDAPFTVVVDYAHTPDALVNVLKTSRDLTQGRLICVFGCGGDRDKTKRPVMAGAVAENCDQTVITSDNPRSEKPRAIINDIVKGMPLDFPHIVIEDRREAIRCALRSARSGDCVVIAGKGHEAYQEINGVRHHFDDRETVLEIYKEMVNSNAA
ncbi:MAG: UDP-N-acetylmuramoyl-L-alanyl-D-glutamate--2,6-diaminopimelate ligase [Chitinispirillales bacterium]|jgi:UDP-N-acetylmuramoyl-L-alanyl-D-glutamate--2,6-diaminopimelate ligase|nr:UDP-N-acetylmuramoyl-L-alanyl-D-glutamate--2,6-diaminopimelate ligase [Chitinispirillales bacterium]